jgi:hypothetical protein
MVVHEELAVVEATTSLGASPLLRYRYPASGIKTSSFLWLDWGEAFTFEHWKSDSMNTLDSGSPIVALISNDSSFDCNNLANTSLLTPVANEVSTSYHDIPPKNENKQSFLTLSH